MELYIIGVLVTLGYLANADKKNELKWYVFLLLCFLWPLVLGHTICSLYDDYQKEK